MVRGSGCGPGVGSRMSHGPNVVRPATGKVGSGVVLVGQWADWRPMGSRIGHWPAAFGQASLSAMALLTPHRRAPRLGMLVGGSVYGALLTAAGLGMAYLVLATPIALGIWSLSLIAGGALLLAGTNRLAVTLARLRAGDGKRGPGAQALASMADEVAVLAEVVPNEGRAIPELAIGPFGAAVIHALPSSQDVRQVGASWELRTHDGWVPMENPLDLAMRDAERVRRWFSMADLDFVVRVYAALIVTDQSFPRAATCAVVTPDRLPAWIAALPRQRSLTAARRLRLRALAATPPTPTDRSTAGGW